MRERDGQREMDRNEEIERERQTDRSRQTETHLPFFKPCYLRLLFVFKSLDF